MGNTATDFQREETVIWDFRRGLENWRVTEGQFSLTESPVLLTIADVSYDAYVSVFGESITFFVLLYT